MLSARRRFYLTISAVILITLTAYFALTKENENFIHIISGLMLSWFLPGFALMSFFYPNKLLRIQTLVFSIVISLIFDVLIGTFLELLNFKLSESGFIISLWLITNLFLITGYFTYPPGNRSISQATSNTIFHNFCNQFKEPLSGNKRGISFYFVLIILVSALLITASWAILVNLEAVNVQSKPFTVLAIEPSSAGLSSNNFQVIINNQENTSMHYRLEMRTDSILFAEWEDIKLETNEQWVKVMAIPQFVNQIDFLLFRQGEVQPYRNVQLIVH